MTADCTRVAEARPRPPSASARSRVLARRSWSGRAEKGVRLKTCCARPATEDRGAGRASLDSSHGLAWCCSGSGGRTALLEDGRGGRVEGGTDLACGDWAGGRLGVGLLATWLRLGGSGGGGRTEASSAKRFSWMSSPSPWSMSFLARLGARGLEARDKLVELVYPQPPCLPVNTP